MSFLDRYSYELPIKTGILDIGISRLATDISNFPILRVHGAGEFSNTLGQSGTSKLGSFIP